MQVPKHIAVQQVGYQYVNKAGSMYKAATLEEELQSMTMCFFVFGQQSLKSNHVVKCAGNEAKYLMPMICSKHVLFVIVPRDGHMGKGCQVK